METVDHTSKNNETGIVLVGLVSSFLILLLNIFRLSWDIKPATISGEMVVAESELFDQTNLS